MDVQGSSPHGEYGRFEQILSQFLLKSLHMILDSRVPSIHPYDRKSDSLSANHVKKSDKWFSLVLGDRPAALDDLSFWHTNLMDPMIIDIILVPEMSNSLSGPGLGTPEETVIERWVVQYEYARTMAPQIGDSSAAYKKTYKKLIILLRSLFSMMRLLPAHRAFRKLCSSSKSCDFDINYKVSSFSAPFSVVEEEMMKRFSFNPVDFQQGSLSISVKYRESLSDFNLETSTLFPPQIITDYVGSPATDPLRAFPSNGKGVCATSFPSRGIQPPLSTTYQRPHSWTSGIHRGTSLVQNQPLGGYPPQYCSSTGRRDFSSSPTDIYDHKISNYRLPNHYKNNSFDDYQLSPPFSPSLSPSPPTYITGGNLMQSRLRSDTAPVSIPHPMLGRSPRYLSPNMSDPNRHSLPPLSPRSIKHDSSSQESPSGMRSLKKLESSRAGELNRMTGPNSGQKVSRDSKDDSGRFSGLLSSSGSPRIGFSRISSRLSFQDDLDGCDFSCPFIVDDVDTSDPQASKFDVTKASEISSQDAAVGALIHMFRRARPLRQDSSCYSSRNELERQEAGTTSEFFLPRKTSDALEELRAYKDIKDLLLLSKSATQLASKEAA